MLKRMVLAAFCVLMPSIGWAQTTQESYLPSKSQLYFRWDGMQTHRADYDKTAVGKMMKGETGQFLDELWKYAQEQILNAARNEPKIGPALKDLTKLISSMYQNGLVMGIEVDQVMPPKVEAVMVFPKGGGESGALLPLLQKIGEEANAEVKNTRVGGRLVASVKFEYVQLGWWGQGDDAVFYVGTHDPVDFAKAIDAKKTGLANNPLYKKLANFKEFKTASRGYFDMTSVLKVASEAAPQANDIINVLGLRGVKSLTFYSGFDGLAERSIVDVDVPGPRKGLLSLSNTKKISLKDLPKLPNDLTGFSASSVSLNKSYGVITEIIEGVVRAFDPNKADEIKEHIKAFEGAVGVDLNNDLFGNLGDVVVSYSSPTDGFLGTGAVVAIQLKDGKKLDRALEKLVKAIPAFPGGQVGLKRKTYHGGEILQLHIHGDQINFHLASIGIYKNWLLYASYPQPIKGFILRQAGVLPAWEADESLTKALAAFPKEFNAIQVSDPRPIVQTVLALTPTVMNLINTVGSIQTPFGGALLPGFRPFDLELIPHAQEATRHLFPNVTISIDDGKRQRIETRGSLLLPF